MRRAAKRDDNEALIVTALQSAGWTVLRVSDAGIMDLLAARNGVLAPLEVKGPKGELTPKQKETFAALARAGIIVQVVRSPAEALRLVGAPSEFDGRPVRTERWLAENGAFLCESCWLPENGLHAKDCPTRKALARPPKVTRAYRAAKTLEEALPKLVRDMVVHGESAMLVTAEGVTRVDLRPSRGVEGELQPLPKRGGAKAGTGDARAVITALRRMNQND